MNRTIVFTFSSPEGGKTARAALRAHQKSHALGLDDAVVLTKDVEGRLHRQRDLSTAVVVGAIAGGLMGLLLMFMFPVVSVVFGVVVGGLIGHFLADRPIENQVVADAGDALEPNSSALLVLVDPGSLSTLGNALRGSGARVYQSTLACEQESALREAVENSGVPLPVGVA